MLFQFVLYAVGLVVVVVAILYTAFGAFGIRGCYEFSLKKKFPLRLIGVYLSWYVQSASSAHRVQQTLFAIDLV